MAILKPNLRPDIPSVKIKKPRTVSRPDLTEEDGEEIEDSRRSHIAEEAADVLICLVNFCTQAGIDLPRAFHEKLARNAAKYPVDKAKGVATKYNEL